MVTGPLPREEGGCRAGAEGASNRLDDGTSTVDDEELSGTGEEKM